jgi:GGDEF domain-containing protein
VSVGVYTYPDYALEPDQLIKNADAAMYVIKGTGRNGLHIFSQNTMEEGKVQLEPEDV